MRWMLLLGLLAASTATIAQHRCVENGKTVITNRPCSAATHVVDQPPTGNTPKVVGDIDNSAYSTPFGTWRGEIQYQARVTGVTDQEAMAIVALTIDIYPQGRVMGSSPENGCRLRGIASPGAIPTSIALDVTLAGCNFRGYNRRLFGTLSVNPAQRYAQFSLNGSHLAPLASMQFFDIKGTLRR